MITLHRKGGPRRVVHKHAKKNWQPNENKGLDLFLIRDENKREKRELVQRLISGGTAEVDGQLVTYTPPEMLDSPARAKRRQAEPGALSPPVVATPAREEVPDEREESIEDMVSRLKGGL
jgi:hypothetical protein